MTPQQYLELFPDGSKTIDWSLFDYPHSKPILETASIDWPLSSDELLLVTERLKKLADQAMYANVHQHCWELADLLILLGTQSERYEPLDRAYRARANYFAYGEIDYPQAIAYCELAEQLCLDWNDEAGVARAQVTKLWPLTLIGEQGKAIEAGERARIVLNKHQDWHQLANLLNNMCVIYDRMTLKDSHIILALYDEILVLYERVNAFEQIPIVHVNRAERLHVLGRFSEAEAILKTAIVQLREGGQLAEAIRAEINLGSIYFSKGDYSKAMQIFEEARKGFAGRLHELAWIDLKVTNFLLELGRFQQVKRVCQEAILYFETHQMWLESGQVLLTFATAQAALGEYNDAIQTLADAHQRYSRHNHPKSAMTARLEQAAIYLRMERFPDALILAQQCHVFFQTHDLSIEMARALLIMAESALLTDKLTVALRWIETLQQLEEPSLSIQFQIARLLAELMIRTERYERAREYIEQALDLIELWQGRLMVELRSDFLDDKQSIYELAVRLALQMGDSETALSYAERAKSRALVDLFAQRIDLQLEARNVHDETLIEQIQTTREQRDQLYRELRSSKQSNGSPNTIRSEIVRLETEIQAAREVLLNRNADYLQDLSLSQVHTESIQQYLPPDAVLVEYFVIDNQYIAWVISAEAVRVYQLSASQRAIQRLQKSLELDFDAALRRNEVKSTKKTLHKLYKKLWQPFEPTIEEYKHIFVVPHGALHYLPFHALYRGDRYLTEDFSFSYLPNATMLRYLKHATCSNHALIMGYSWDGRLPHAEREAQSIASQVNEAAFVGQHASRANFYQHAPNKRLIHLATHGEFSSKNPLFSRLILDDGDVTMLDLLNMRLDASLVVLSACETGRSAIGGGDELIGFTRALLYAGVASPLLTLWRVDDEQTSTLMTRFYHYLQCEHLSKAIALQAAQRDLIQADVHPYFWASFVLIGNPSDF